MARQVTNSRRADATSGTYGVENIQAVSIDGAIVRFIIVPDKQNEKGREWKSVLVINPTLPISRAMGRDRRRARHCADRRSTSDPLHDASLCVEQLAVFCSI